MGTRSYIGIAEETPKGVIITGKYCHWNGYPTYNGLILQRYYKDENKVKDLIDLGDMSSLGRFIGTKHDFETTVEDECTFYNRDREEEWNDVKPKVYRSFPAFIKAAENHDGAYAYMFYKGTWYVHAISESYINEAEAKQLQTGTELPQFMKVTKALNFLWKKKAKEARLAKEIGNQIERIEANNKVPGVKVKTEFPMYVLSKGFTYRNDWTVITLDKEHFTYRMPQGALYRTEVGQYRNMEIHEMEAVIEFLSKKI